MADNAIELGGLRLSVFSEGDGTWRLGIQSAGGTVTATAAGTAVIRNEQYSTIATGEVAGGTAAAQLPDVACKLARIRAVISNGGNVYLGGSAVTRPDGTTDTTTGWELAPGDETGWVPMNNLNSLYRICDNTTDDIVYWTVN